MKNNIKRYAIKRAATGLGMFALTDIAKGTKIVRYVGTRITNKEAEQTDGRYIIYLNKTYALNGKQRDNAARYINHSCQPNAVAYTTGRQVWIWSLKAIRAGEEITLDYGEEYFDLYIKPVGCRCVECKMPLSKRG